MIKFLLTVLLVILVPTYIHNYGMHNFLWFSDVALFLIFFAVWLESSLLMSMALVLTFFMEFMWTIDFFSNLILEKNIIGLANYMFQTEYSILLRSLSLFHLLLPTLPIFYLREWGYNKHALGYSLLLYWVIILCCYNFTPIEENINWVHYPQVYNWQNITSDNWILLLMILYPLLIMLPKNYIFSRIFKVANPKELHKDLKVCRNLFLNH